MDDKILLQVWQLGSHAASLARAHREAAAAAAAVEAAAAAAAAVEAAAF